MRNDIISPILCWGVQKDVKPVDPAISLLALNSNHYFLTPLPTPLERIPKSYFHPLSKIETHVQVKETGGGIATTPRWSYTLQKVDFCTSQAGQNNRLKLREQASNGTWWVRQNHKRIHLSLTESFTRDLQAVPYEMNCKCSYDSNPDWHANARLPLPALILWQPTPTLNYVIKHSSEQHQNQSPLKCKSKPQWDIISHLLGCLLSKRQEITNAGMNVQKREPLCTAGGNVNWCSHYGKTVWRFLKKLKLEYHIIQKFHFWAYIQRKWNHCLKEISALPYSLHHYSK